MITYLLWLGQIHGTASEAAKRREISTEESNGVKFPGSQLSTSYIMPTNATRR